MERGPALGPNFNRRVAVSFGSGCLLNGCFWLLLAASLKTTKYVLKYTIDADEAGSSLLAAILTVFRGRRAVIPVKQVLESGLFPA